MKRIKRFGIFQTAKMAAILYFVLALVIMVPMFLFTSMLGLSGSPYLSMFSGGMLFILPILYAFIAFIFTAIMCWMYNLVAGMTGGIEVEIETTDAS